MQASSERWRAGRPAAAPGAFAEVDVILRDGRTLRLRPPTRADVPALTDFFRALSPQSLYNRFHGTVAVDDALSERFVDPDFVERGALIGVTDDRVVALANWARLRDPRSAEAAFAVADELQGHGVGTRLLERLAALAGEAGIERFVAEVLPSNVAMLRVFAGAGLEVAARDRRGQRRDRVPDRGDARLRHRRRLARPRRRRRVAAPVLRAASRRRRRRLGAPRHDRRRALPQRPRRRVRRRRVPGEPQRGAGRRRPRVRDRSRRFPTSSTSSSSAFPASTCCRRRSRRCAQACARSASSPPASPSTARRAARARRSCSRSCARTARGCSARTASGSRRRRRG